MSDPSTYLQKDIQEGYNNDQDCVGNRNPQQDLSDRCIYLCQTLEM